MQTFAQKQNQSQKPASSDLARSQMATRPHHGVDLVLHLQRTIGNQAVQRMLHTRAEERKARLTATASSRFGHDLSRVPVHSLAGGTRTKLQINKPGDEYEQEADHDANEVMRMPEPRLQRACTCGGGCPTCQEVQPSRNHPSLQMKRVQASDAGQIEAPPNVHEALHSPGQPLDSVTRRFMESRFGHDFSQVRVYTDSEAAKAARAVQARAYTIGRDVVFGTGEYTPATVQGKRLLAHELAHTLQQRGSNAMIHRVALHTGRILHHGSCYHLACQSTWAIEDRRHGYNCAEGTMHAGRRMRPLLACDRDEAGAHAQPCRETQMAIPHSRWRGLRSGQCGQNLVICANGRFTHGMVRDRSNREAWEIGTRLLRNLGVTGDVTDGAIYPDESDAEFRRDSRCRGARATTPRPSTPRPNTPRPSTPPATD